jgi:polysaccharide export outer membrane protein
MFDRFLTRMHVCGAIFVAAALLGGGAVCLATEPDHAGDVNDRPVNTVTGNSGLKLNQQELLREFEAASVQEYTIGAGDEIDVQVPTQSDLQGHHVVGPDGRITLPLVGPMKVSGMTREAAADAMNKAWSQYYSNVSVTVQVTKYSSNRIVVVGRVSSPGPLYFDTAPTLLEALAKSGAYSARPIEGATSNPVTRTGSPAAMISRCAIYRGTEQVLWIDMQDLFASGAGVDLHLRRDDVVFVPDEQETLVSVLGQVVHPGAIRLTPDTRLVDVLAMAGGLTEDAASDKIRIVRPSTGQTREVALKDMLAPGKSQTIEVSLQRGDVIYVPKSGLGKFGYVLNKFSPAGSLLMFGAIAGGK